MTNTATTARTIVTVEQAAELNELFLTWHKANYPDATDVERTRALRHCDWQSCEASAFEACKAVMNRDLALKARRAWAAM